jgi:two-component system sensor histidine kinase BaeS
MSFRLRVLALVSLVAVIAVGATAYLAFRQASRQVSESVAADQETSRHIVDALDDYAQHHGTWEGVPQTVHNLATGTGQRIKLVTDSGIVVVDTDTLEGRTARAVTTPPVVVDPRPSLTLPAQGVSLSDATLQAISRYRSGVRLAACLTRQGLRVTMTPGAYGIPDYSADPATIQDSPGQVEECRAVLAATGSTAADAADVSSCQGGAIKTPPRTPAAQADTNASRRNEPAIIDCLQKAFNRRTSDVAPVPLRLYLGAVDKPGPSLAPGPVTAAAVLVALLAVAGTALLSRRVLRPIGELTAASQRLGEGDLSLRVPVVGRDELAQLARSFNRMADSLQRGEQRQRRLVADVAHELRTPLANLRGYLEALKDGVVPAGPELFASLHEEAVLQQRIVDDLQDLALAEAGALAYHRSRVDLAELLETCRTAQQAVADAARVALRVEAGGPVIVKADPDRLRQVIGNLVANALRATPAGRAVTLRAIDSDDGQATVVVHDTGVGISAEDLPHIFDRFWRADAARGRATGGTGLGLAIARQIITDHSGHITAESERGVGTTVTITLPLDPEGTTPVKMS